MAPPRRDSISQTIAEGVVEHLTDRIMRGELEPGAHLVAEAIATELAVSPIPVREALRELATAGLVEIRPRRGAFVRSPGGEDPAALIGLFDVRLHLEPWVAAQAARHRSAEELEAVAGACQRGASCLAVGDLAGVGRAHFDLLQAIARASHNEFALDALTPLHHATVLALTVTARVTLPGGWESHRDTVAAIERRDAAGAARLTRAHLVAMRDALRQLLANTPQ